MVEVIDWKDNEDGSAKITIEMSEKEKDSFTRIGIIQCLKEGIKEMEESSDE